MKKLILAAIVAAVPGLAAADPIYGTWKSSQNEEGNFLIMNIAACGSKICGTITGVSAGGDQSVVGKRMLWDMESRGGGAYGGGKIWAADTDKTYRSKLTLDGNNLATAGCVGPICRSVNWSRQ